VTSTAKNSRRSGDAARAWRFFANEMRFVRELRRRVGIRQALVDRVKYNLELQGVDRALVTELNRTRGELAATRADLAAQKALTQKIERHLEIGEWFTWRLAGPPAVERLLALGYWLSQQPPTDLTVSVVTPTRSRPRFVSEAIASVQAQSHPHWELIVVDDGSEDETRDVLAAIDDERVRSVRTEGVGSAAARQVGLEAATGDVVAYLDDDNVMLPDWLRAVAWAFSRFQDTDVIYGASVVEDEIAVGSDGPLPRLVFNPFDRKLLLEHNYVDASVIAHRAHLPQAHWDPEFTGIGDWDLIIRLTEKKPALALPIPAVLYRTGAPGRETDDADAQAAQRRLEEHLIERGLRGAGRR
jgi:hypothetical protein